MASQGEKEKLRQELEGPRADDELTVDELKEVGRVIFGAADLFGLYGLNPDGLYKAGCHIVGRTAIECKIDLQCDPVANAVKEVVAAIPGSSDKEIVVFDPFSGSGNLLYHVTDILKAKVGYGFELDPKVAKSASENLHKRPDTNANVQHGTLIPDDPNVTYAPVTADTILIVNVDPPWGKGFEFGKGLALDKTDPTVPDVLTKVTSKFGDDAAQIIFVIATPGNVVESSVDVVLETQTLLKRGTGNTLPDDTNGGYIICTPKK